MMLWNKAYQEYDFVVSSVTTKVKGVALTNLPGVGNIVWDVVDYSGPSQVRMAVCTRSVKIKYFINCLHALLYDFHLSKFSLTGKEFVFCGDQCGYHK